MSNFSAEPPNQGSTSASALDPQSAPGKKQKNILGIVAFILAIVGFIFACIPGALIVGWVLLPIAFILAIVSLFMKGKKGFGVAALVISIVGTIVGVVVFFSVVSSAVDDAFSGEEITATSPGTDADQTDGAGETQNDEGTRANPYPIGTAITQGDWTVTVNSTTLDSTQAVLNENPYNETPAEGSQYLLVNITATYNGDAPEGSTPWVDLEYVTVDGNTINSYDAGVTIPDRFDSLSTLYTGASTSGNFVFEVPTATAGEGVLAVTPDMFGDKAFVSVQ